MFNLRGEVFKVKDIVGVRVRKLSWKNHNLRWSLSLLRLGGDKLKTPKRYNYRDLGCYALVVCKGILQEDERHFGVWRMYVTTCGITEKTNGNWRQVNLLEDRIDHSGELKRLWSRLVELPKIPSVVRYKKLQEGKTHFEVWRGKGENLWDYKV